MFKCGDKVQWTSSAHGSSKKKVGEVVEVLPPRVMPDFWSLKQEHGSRDAYGGGHWRYHESYIVLVPHHGKGKPTLYWPRVSALRKVTS